MQGIYYSHKVLLWFLKNNMVAITSKQNIPKGWQRVKLGDISDITNGKTNTQDAVADGEYPLFDRSIAIKRSNKYLFDKTAVVLPGEGAEFVPRYYSGKFDLHQRVYAIFPSNVVYPLYLFQYLYANRAIFAQNAVGSTVKSLRLPIIQAVDVLLPPLTEQKRIAEILVTVDEEIQKTEEITSQTEKLKKGLMQQLFAKGIGHTKFKKTKIGSIPEEWQAKTVGELCDLGRGRVINKKELQENPGPYPVYSSQTSNNGEFGRIATYDFEGEYVTWTTDGEYAGATFYRNGKFNCTNVCGTLKATVPLDMRYLSLVLEVYAEKYVVKTANPKLMNGVMSTVIIPVPPIAEQKKIAEVLLSCDEKLSVNKKLKAKLTLLKKGLMQDLLSGKVRTK